MISVHIAASFLQTCDELVFGAEATGQLLDEGNQLQHTVSIFRFALMFGSLFVCNRPNYRMAMVMVGEMCGVLAIGLQIDSFLGLAGLVLLATSRDGFLPECG